LRDDLLQVYMTAIERALLSRLDHAAYLGRELADKVCASQLPRRLRIEPIVMGGRQSLCQGTPCVG
jgi:hypothetical protein